MTRDEALAKIKKCLSLGKSSNPHEAAAAMRQAQKLMAAFDLDPDAVELAQVSERGSRSRNQAIVVWEVQLANMVSAAFGCDMLTQARWVQTGARWDKRRDYVFVGVGPAPEVASFAYDVLARMLANDRSRHIQALPKSCRAATKTAGGDAFAHGWLRGVADELQRFARTERDDELIARYLNSLDRSMRTVQPKRRGNGRASLGDLACGIVAGNKAKLASGLPKAVGQAQLGK